ncbi:hypothetical protein Slala05_82830 [Streptomyces lavendulae subsp. lavendulae]|nr:hypothetical protein Slala05_82830 [Streptomyces lavendulae subsp. lavendulae]
MSTTPGATAAAPTPCACPPSTGKLKETAGRLMGNERLTAEGRAERAKGDAREARG